MPPYDPIRDCERSPVTVSVRSPRKGSLDAILDGGLRSPSGSPAALDFAPGANGFSRPTSANSLDGADPRSPFLASTSTMVPLLHQPPRRRDSAELSREEARRSSSPLRASVEAGQTEVQGGVTTDDAVELARAIFPAVTEVHAASANAPAITTQGPAATTTQAASASPKSASRPPRSAAVASPADDAKPVMIPAPQPSRPGVAKPYAPHRSTVAHSVLHPLSEADRLALLETMQNPLRTGPPQPPPDPGEPSSFAVDAITKAGSSSFLDMGGQSAIASRKRGAQEMMGDVREVADHYNKRQNTGIHERNQSPIIGLRNFNNWIKSVLIDRYSRQPAIPQGQYRPPLKVLDMGCGKGGDLRKWVIAGVDQYVGLDLADVSIEQAAGRWRELPSHKRFPAHFAAMDCFTDSLANNLDPSLLARPFDTVSMQFCMHYAFSSLATARVMLENVTRFLRPGGVFLGTIPDSDFLLGELMELPADSTSWTFGNSVYKVTFDERGDEFPLYGQRYSFFLQDAVEDVPEYVVHWSHFVELAAEYGLQLVFHETFHTLFEDANEDPEYKQMLIRMGVANAEGESELTEDQWNIANLYAAFAFVMQDPAASAA